MEYLRESKGAYTGADYRPSDEHLHQQNGYDETNEQLCHLKKLFCRLTSDVLPTQLTKGKGFSRKTEAMRTRSLPTVSGVNDDDALRKRDSQKTNNGSQKKTIDQSQPEPMPLFLVPERQAERCC